MCVGDRSLSCGSSTPSSRLGCITVERGADRSSSEQLSLASNLLLICTGRGTAFPSYCAAPESQRLPRGRTSHGLLYKALEINGSLSANLANLVDSAMQEPLDGH